MLSTGFRFAGADWAGLDPVWCSHSTPHGTSWTVHRQVAVAVPEPWLIPHGRIHALRDGDLAASFYHAEGPKGPSRAWLALSRDQGATWTCATRIGDTDTNEVVLLPRSGDAWLAIARTQKDHHLVLWRSLDQGATWGAPLALTDSMQHPGDLTDLGDGRVLLTYGIRNRGRTGIGAKLSVDGGITWGASTTLIRFEGATDCGYPSTIRRDGGDLLTACYSNSSPLESGYHLLIIRWSLDELLSAPALR